MLQIPNSQKTATHWSVQDARELYSIHNWGSGFFDINQAGDVVALGGNKESDVEKGVSLIDVIDGLKERGIDAPVLLRFPDILDSRLRSMYSAFKAAFEEYGYRGTIAGFIRLK